MSYVAVK